MILSTKSQKISKTVEKMIKTKIVEQAVSEIISAKKITALTGAGISVESGIAAFRGKGGLWEKYDPEEYANVETFKRNPEKSWIMLKDMGKQILRAKPNPAHHSISRLQKIGKLDSVITQNVDNLHQAAGTINVIEFHGNYKKLLCLECGSEYEFEYHMINNIPPAPRCECDAVLKPKVVLFGETPPFSVIEKSKKEANSCDAMIVVGTSAMVYPSGHIPFVAYKNKATIIEINTEKSYLTPLITKYFLRGKAGEILPKIVEKIEKQFAI